MRSSHGRADAPRAGRERVLGTAIATVLAGAVAAPAVAQQSAPQGAEAALEEVTVTGSRIARQDAESVGALTTLTAEDIAAAAPLSVGDLLQELPGAGVSLNSNGTQGTSFGVSSINLRYLGSVEGSGNRVLVLVDGHRWVNAAGGRGFRDFVDLNTIPLGIVESIEVLKDGASAIYGADAIAGVVNIRTRRKVDGLEAKLNFGRTTREDGAALSAELNFGHSWDRLSFLVSGTFVDTDPIETLDRPLTAVASAPVTAPPNSPRGLFVLPGVSTAAAPLTRIPGAAGSATTDFRVATLPADFFNTQAQGIWSVGPSRRVGVFGRVAYEISDSVNAYVEALYNDRESEQLFSPLLLDVRGTNGITLAADHPFNPWARAFTGTALRLQRIPVEVGNRLNAQNVITRRLAAGLDGRLELLGTDWKWDLFASRSKNDASFRAFNQINLDNVALGLGPNARCQANSCVPLNLFGTLTPTMADYIRFNGEDRNGTEQTNAAFNFAGQPFSMPAGEVGLAAGFEWRRESAYDRPDAFANSAPRFITNESRTSSATRDPTTGEYSLWEAYTEVNVPLLRDAPLAAALDVDAAVRFSDYDTFGSTTTSKFGLAWRPVEDLLVRGTYSEGFRAPSILELFQGERQTTFQAVDPCNGGGAGRPGCVGVPTTYNQNQFGAGTIRGTVGGNRNLQPETADTFSAGLAYTPSWADGMSFTADWWQIEIDDAIASQTAQQILNSCANRAGVFCDLVRRGSTGEVLDLRQAVVNFSRIEVEGLDLTWRYAFDTGVGRFEALLDGARLMSFKTFAPQPDGTVLIDERAGKGDTPRATYPKWKGQAGLRWSQGPFSAGWRARYIGESTDIAGNALNGGTTDDVIYQDLQFGFEWERLRTSFTLGVDNVLNELPPASRANSPINFDIYTYDVRGTYWYVKLATKL